MTWVTWGLGSTFMTMTFCHDIQQDKPIFFKPLYRYMALAQKVFPHLQNHSFASFPLYQWGCFGNPIFLRFFMNEATTGRSVFPLLIFSPAKMPPCAPRHFPPKHTWVYDVLDVHNCTSPRNRNRKKKIFVFWQMTDAKSIESRVWLAAANIKLLIR